MNRQLLLNNLLVKSAVQRHTRDEIPEYGFRSHLGSRMGEGVLLALGHNGVSFPAIGANGRPQGGVTLNPTTWKSRGRQALALGSIAAGGIGGGYLGRKGGDWVSKRLGLTADRGGWRKHTGRFIRNLGTAAGATTGILGGTALAGLMSGSSKYDRNRTHYLASLLSQPGQDTDLNQKAFELSILDEVKGW